MAAPAAHGGGSATEGLLDAADADLVAVNVDVDTGRRVGVDTGHEVSATRAVDGDSNGVDGVGGGTGDTGAPAAASAAATAKPGTLLEHAAAVEATPGAVHALLVNDMGRVTGLPPTVVPDVMDSLQQRLLPPPEVAVAQLHVDDQALAAATASGTYTEVSAAATLSSAAAAGAATASGAAGAGSAAGGGRESGGGSGRVRSETKDSGYRSERPGNLGRATRANTLDTDEGTALVVTSPRSGLRRLMRAPTRQDSGLSASEASDETTLVVRRALALRRLASTLQRKREDEAKAAGDATIAAAKALLGPLPEFYANPIANSKKVDAASVVKRQLRGILGAKGAPGAQAGVTAAETHPTESPRPTPGPGIQTPGALAPHTGIGAALAEVRVTTVSSQFAAVTIVSSVILFIVGAAIPLDVAGVMAGNPVRHWMWMSALIPLGAVASQVCERLWQTMWIKLDEHTTATCCQTDALVGTIVIYSRTSVSLILCGIGWHVAWESLLVYPAAARSERAIVVLLVVLGVVVGVRNLMVHWMMRSAVSRQFGDRIRDMWQVQLLVLAFSSLGIAPEGSIPSGGPTPSLEATERFEQLHESVARMPLSAMAAFAQRGALQYTLRNGDVKSVRTAREVPAMARVLYDNLAGGRSKVPNTEVLGADASWRFYSPGVQNNSMRLFYDYDAMPPTVPPFHITLEVLTQSLLRRLDEVRTLRRSMQSTESASTAIKLLCNSLAAFIFFVAFIVAFDASLFEFILPFSTMILALSFVFGNSLKQLLESLIFVIGLHPFDVEDRVVIDGETMFVHEIGLMVTTFKSVDGKVLTMPNSSLASKRIENHRRSPEAVFSLTIHVGLDTTDEQLLALRLGAAHWVSNAKRLVDHVNMYVPVYDTLNGYMAVAFWLTHRYSWQDKQPINTDLSNFTLRINALCRKLGIRYHRVVQPISAAPSATGEPGSISSVLGAVDGRGAAGL